MKLWKHLLAICLALGIMLSLLPGSVMAADGDEVPTPDEVYNVLIAQKDIEGFTEGTIWNDHTHTYRNFKGGPPSMEKTSLQQAVWHLRFSSAT